MDPSRVRHAVLLAALCSPACGGSTLPVTPLPSPPPPRQGTASATPAVADAPARARAEAAAVGRGREVFAHYCVACHGARGQGVIGPNLTDTRWIHPVSARESVAEIIADGVPVHGMPAWSALLSAAERDAVAAYVWSIRGANEPGRAPQGEFTAPLVSPED